jgi:hypothetical protein
LVVTCRRWSRHNGRQYRDIKKEKDMVVEGSKARLDIWSNTYRARLKLLGLLTVGVCAEEKAWGRKKSGRGWHTGSTGHGEKERGETGARCWAAKLGRPVGQRGLNRNFGFLLVRGWGGRGSLADFGCKAGAQVRS